MNATALVEGTEKQKASIHYINSDTVYTDIMEFLSDYKIENTRKAYKSDISEYFAFMCSNKDISMLTKDDVEKGMYDENLLEKHANRYKRHLMEKHPDSESTVIRKISTIRALYKKLQINRYDVNYLIFHTKGLKMDNESYDAIPYNLVKPMAILAESNPYFGSELSTFLLVAAQTSFRVNALLNLTKDNIKFNSDRNRYTVTVIDKGRKKRTMPLDTDIHAKVVELVKAGDGNNPLLFQNIKSDWIRKAIKKMAESFPELKGKYITTHSLRSSAPVYEQKTTGNTLAGIQQTGHKNYQTYVDHYVDKTENYDSLAGIRMFKDTNKSVLEQISKEEILEALEKINSIAYHQLLLELERCTAVVKQEGDI